LDITSGLRKTIGVVSQRTISCRVTSQCKRKSSLRSAMQASNACRPSSVKVSKVGLRMLPLSRLDLLLSEFPLFIFDVLEVVDSPAESPKCVATRIEQEPEAPNQNCRNRTARFGKSDGPVLSILAVRGTTATQRGSFSFG
jgi:hypothetical protein